MDGAFVDGWRAAGQYAVHMTGGPRPYGPKATTLRAPVGGTGPGRHGKTATQRLEGEAV